MTGYRQAQHQKMVPSDVTKNCNNDWFNCSVLIANYCFSSTRLSFKYSVLGKLVIAQLVKKITDLYKT